MVKDRDRVGNGRGRGLRGHDRGREAKKEPRKAEEGVVDAVADNRGTFQRDITANTTSYIVTLILMTNRKPGSIARDAEEVVEAVEVVVGTEAVIRARELAPSNITRCLPNHDHR
jgi:hypothetical protein